MDVSSRNSDGEEETLTSSESSGKDTSGTASSYIFFLVIWILFSIAMIVIGSLYIHECSTEPKIPIYLIVAGTSYLFGIVLFILKLVALKLTFGLEVLLCLFSFCWFTAGSIWVFTIYQEDSRDCNEIVFDFAFGALIFQYIFLAFISVIVCLCSCCVGFLTMNRSEHN
ncbi:transmembrane protein 272-like isoform X2 [Hyla sarda]|uniref:transmembrane protein 272-like isoform X2 n=1 Tax=Hyla sarda TaxID=327740 RepID=UPI0024C3F1DB|nr:transmembrane protein 272-like isoform X2 [Hyla sarda]